MLDRTFDNRLRHGKQLFELPGTNTATFRASGARFEKVTLDEEIGPEIVVMLTDLSPFADELKRHKPFELRLKTGVAQTSLGPVLFLLWWVPPITNGEPFALYEQILNPTHTRVLEMLRQIARQTHLHLLLIGPGHALLDVYEFASTFGLEKLISVSESACKVYGSMDFVAAKEEYDRTHDLMELFDTSEPESEIASETEAEKHTGREDEFPIERSSRALVDGTVWLAGKLLKHRACNREKRDALAKAMVGLARLPRATRGLCVDFGFSIRQAGGDIRYWSVHFDETELMWSVGGCVHGPAGPDSFTSFQGSLLLGSEGAPIGDAGAWAQLNKYLTQNINVQADDASDEGFWELYAPMMQRAESLTDDETNDLNS